MLPASLIHNLNTHQPAIRAAMIVHRADTVLPVINRLPVDGGFAGGASQVDVINEPVHRFTVRIGHRIK